MTDALVELGEAFVRLGNALRRPEAATIGDLAELAAKCGLRLEFRVVMVDKGEPTEDPA